LYLLINPKGSKWWRLDYSINGKRKTLSLGTYPTVTLSDVRNKAIEARQQVAKGINPSDTGKEAKATQRAKIENEKRVDVGLPVIDSFACVAMDWYDC
jgi:hypothetical protein